MDDDQRYHLPEGGRPDSRLIDDQHNILIEDSSTLRTAPPFKPSPAVYATSSAPPPAVEEEHRVYLGTLFKPGILAGMIVSTRYYFEFTFINFYEESSNSRSHIDMNFCTFLFLRVS